MKAVKVQASQVYASWRIPVSLSIKESYPLPPYSTVIGMVHAACGFTSYQPMDVSIQGTYYSRISDLYTRYEFKPGMKYEAGRHQLAVKYNDDIYGITCGPGLVELIVDIELVFHIRPYNESLIPKLLEGLIYPSEYPSLGRREDLLSIEHVTEVELQSRIPERQERRLKYDAWVPIDTEAERGKVGTIYILNKNYEIDSKTQTRMWNRVTARHIPKGTGVGGRTLLFDNDPEGTDAVFFA